jgi:hypothetical protein
MSPVILFQHCLSFYHTSSMGGAPELMILNSKFTKTYYRLQNGDFY